MGIAQEIARFSAKREPWQQDAIRRICAQPDLTDADLEEVFSLLKAEKQVEPSSLTAVPYAAEHLGTGAPGSRPVRLAKLSDAQNVNRLAPSQTLLFARDGLTICYGDNGSGKSGYCRILKQLCRVRQDRPEPILGDVFKPQNHQPPQATITYMVGDTLQPPHVWKDGQNPPSALARISVFDAATVPLYADKQNKIEFLPHGLDVLPRLGKVCDDLQRRLDAELAALKRAIDVPITGVLRGTASETFLSLIALGTSPRDLPADREIHENAAWNEADDHALAEVENELAVLSEPQKNATALERMARVLESIAATLFSIEDVIGDRAIDSIREQQALAIEYRKRATEAATGRFAGDPLPGVVAVDAWKRMYKCACELSSVVYAGEQFPVLRAGAVCMLCQQAISPEAAERFARFQDFLVDTAEAEAEREEDAFNRRVLGVRNLVVPTFPAIELQVAEYRDARPDAESVLGSIRSFIDAAQKRLTFIIHVLTEGLPLDHLPPAPHSTAAELNHAATALRDLAAQLLKDSADAFQVRSKGQVRDELLGRRALSEIKKVVLGRAADIRRYNALRACRDACDTRQISIENSKLREKYLTAHFSHLLQEQITALGIAYLPLKLETHTDRGASFLGVGLGKTQVVKNSAILSEGEFRALALACFLTEISTIPAHSGIIVDDPVSSLDHLHIREVADRLAVEAKQRQVVVFTHNLSFYYELMYAAVKCDVAVHENWIFKDEEQGCGVVSPDDAPWQVKKVKDRLTYLDKLVNSFNDAVPSSSDKYLRKVTDFYRCLRETWERAVEEVVLGDVVGRFKPEVKTQSLKKVLVTDDDYKTVFLGMKKASEYSGHDRPVAREGTPPSVAEMRKDLNDLREYVKAARTRAKSVEEQREQLEVPRKAATAT